jgi:hypothetical protein
MTVRETFSTLFRVQGFVPAAPSVRSPPLSP